MYILTERLFRDLPVSSKVQARPRRGWIQDNHNLGFKNIGCLPTKLLLTRPDDGDGIDKTLQNHSAGVPPVCMDCAISSNFPSEKRSRDSAAKIKYADERHIKECRYV